MRSNPEPELGRTFRAITPANWAINPQHSAWFRALQDANHVNLLREIRALGTEQFNSRQEQSARHLLEVICIRTWHDPVHEQLLRDVRNVGTHLCRARHESQARILLDEISLDIRRTGIIPQVKVFAAYRALKTVFTALSHHLLRIRLTCVPTNESAVPVRQEALGALVIKGESVREFR